jgi:hypothetical protein
VTIGRKRACVVAAVLVAAAFAWAATDQAAAYAARRRFYDPAWHATATVDEVREAAERSLGCWFGTPHDEFIVLGRIGNAASIPHIRAALRRKLPGDLSCGWGHGEEALERLTPGEDASIPSGTPRNPATGSGDPDAPGEAR